MDRVLWPIEPVEPRMASFFTVLFSQIDVIVFVRLVCEHPFVHCDRLPGDCQPGLIAKLHRSHCLGEALSLWLVLQEDG